MGEWGKGEQPNSGFFQSGYGPEDYQIPTSSTRNKVRYRKKNRYVNMIMITIDGEQKRERGSQDKHNGESST